MLRRPPAAHLPAQQGRTRQQGSSQSQRRTPNSAPPSHGPSPQPPEAKQRPPTAASGVGGSWTQAGRKAEGRPSQAGGGAGKAGPTSGRPWWWAVNEEGDTAENEGAVLWNISVPVHKGLSGALGPTCQARPPAGLRKLPTRRPGGRGSSQARPLAGSSLPGGPVGLRTPGQTQGPVLSQPPHRTVTPVSSSKTSALRPQLWVLEPVPPPAYDGTARAAPPVHPQGP